MYEVNKLDTPNILILSVKNRLHWHHTIT